MSTLSSRHHSSLRYELKIVNYTYPFEAGATIFYYFVLAFIFIPLNMELQGALAANRQPLILKFNSSLGPELLSAPCKSFGDSVRSPQQPRTCVFTRFLVQGGVWRGGVGLGFHKFRVNCPKRVSRPSKLEFFYQS